MILALEGVEKRYAKATVPAVSAVQLTVATGEVVGLVGESGCGKSTLLRLVAGLEVPDRGTIRVAGQAVAGGRAWVPPERRGVGMVFQDFALFPHLRAAENVAFGLAGRPRDSRRSRVEAMLELVGLQGYGHRFPHELSGGQQQRVALARALAPEPRILLLDEPFSNLDSALKRAMRDELSVIFARTGITAILVVHEAEDVMALADRVAVMRAGRIHQLERPDALYRHPRDEYVARFFGETNILDGRPSGEGFETEVGFIPCPLAAGSSGPVRLCLRPEHFHLSAGPAGDVGLCASGCGANGVPACARGGTPAVVRQVRQTGLHRRVLLAVENGMPGEMTLTVDASAGPPLAPGDRVWVQPRPGCLHVLQG